MSRKIILGTVQFGLNYGINNALGKPSEEVIFDMLDAAYANGVECLDTADAYGDSIQAIGKYHSLRSHRFKILSKFKEVKVGELQKTAENSLYELQVNAFEVYSFHSYNEYIENASMAKELIRLKLNGLIKKAGISVYTNAEFEKIIPDKDIDVIQMPFNILDNNNLRGSLLNEAERNGKEIHVRSVFLQGLFFMNELPEKLRALDVYMLKIKEYCKLNEISIHELALSYALYNPLITNVLIGIDNKSQLLSNLGAIKNLDKAFDFINKNILVKEIELLNPVNWK